MTRSVGLLAACDDAKLLGIELWPKQREVMTQIDSGRYREVVLSLGRRSGKSLMPAAVAVHDACFRDLTADQRPGERRFVVCVAASREQARIVLDFARGLLTTSRLLRETVELQGGNRVGTRATEIGEGAEPDDDTITPDEALIGDLDKAH